jgi:hypothetical protein
MNEPTPTVVFRRDPEAPTTYAPLVDVRVGQHGLHLLPFVPPAATEADVRVVDGRPVVEVVAGADLLVPLESVERLIRDLAGQFRAAVVGRMRADAAAEGLEMPPDEDIVVEGLQDVFALARNRSEG